MERIKMLRERKGLSQAKAAVLADMNPVTLWRYETGQRSPTVDQLERLAEVLEVEVADFFPKGQDPLSFDPERKVAFEDVIASAAGKWLEDLEGEEFADPSPISQARAIGISEAAGDLQAGLIPPLAQRNLDSTRTGAAILDYLNALHPADRAEVETLFGHLRAVTNKAREIYEDEVYEDDETEDQKELESSDG